MLHGLWAAAVICMHTHAKNILNACELTTIKESYTSLSVLKQKEPMLYTLHLSRLRIGTLILNAWPLDAELVVKDGLQGEKAMEILFNPNVKCDNVYVTLESGVTPSLTIGTLNHRDLCVSWFLCLSVPHLLHYPLSSIMYTFQSLLDGTKLARKICKF